MNREEWLTLLAKGIEPHFLRKGWKPREYRLSCSWPSSNAMSPSKLVVGECHHGLVEEKEVSELFISPLLDEPLKVAGTICHELVHSACGRGVGHKGKFILARNQLGLTKGKPTHAMPGDALNEKLSRIIEKLGPYPHKALKLQPKKSKSSSDLTLKCSACGCSVRISLKWLGEAGQPTCGCGELFIAKED